jgi:hypothetical protein
MARTQFSGALSNKINKVIDNGLLLQLQRSVGVFSPAWSLKKTRAYGVHDAW